MFEISVLISLIVSIIIFFFTVYITLKKELDDLESASPKDTTKIHTRQKTIKYLKMITLFLLFIVILFFFLPSIIDLINNTLNFDFKPINFSSIGDFLLKLVPFKKGFFSDPNFKFSYITGIVISIIVLGIWFYTLYEVIIIPDFASEYITLIVIMLLLAYGLIWANNFISLFLSYCIIHCFAFFAIVFNLIIYVLIFAIITFIMDFF